MLRIDDFDNLPRPPETEVERLRRITRERREARQAQASAPKQIIVSGRKNGKSDLALAMALARITRADAVACDHEGIGLPGCGVCMVKP
jgi:hypothetical protein